MRYLINFMQAITLILITGASSLQYGENLSQVSKLRLCYAVCPLLFSIAGIVVTQIRMLKFYSYVAGFSVFSIWLVMLISMGIIGNSTPNYEIAAFGSVGSYIDPTTVTPDREGRYPAIMHFSGIPDGNMTAAINGLMNAILAYAGLQMFVEFMAEMRRPTDFIKAVWSAQFVIYLSYLIYGSVIYYYQGQYVFNLSYQVQGFPWQTALNMMTLISGLIGAGLYSNIGIKVLYNNVVYDFFHIPITSSQGKAIYAIIVPVWWAIAYVISTGIPDFTGLVSLIEALRSIMRCVVGQFLSVTDVSAAKYHFCIHCFANDICHSTSVRARIRCPATCSAPRAGRRI